MANKAKGQVSAQSGTSSQSQMSPELAAAFAAAQTKKTAPVRELNDVPKTAEQLKAEGSDLQTYPTTQKGWIEGVKGAGAINGFPVFRNQLVAVAAQLERQLTYSETSQVLTAFRAEGDKRAAERKEALEPGPDTTVPENYAHEGKVTCENCHLSFAPTAVNLVIKGEAKLQERGPNAGDPIRIGAFSPDLAAPEGLPACRCRNCVTAVREKTKAEGKLSPRFMTYEAAASVLAYKARQAEGVDGDVESMPQRRQQGGFRQPQQDRQRYNNNR